MEGKDILSKKQQYKLAQDAVILRWGSLEDSPVTSPGVLLLDRGANRVCATYCQIMDNLRLGSAGLPEYRLGGWKGIAGDRLADIGLSLWFEIIDDIKACGNAAALADNSGKYRWAHAAAVLRWGLPEKFPVQSAMLLLDRDFNPNSAQGIYCRIMENLRLGSKKLSRLSYVIQKVTADGELLPWEGASLEMLEAVGFQLWQKSVKMIEEYAL